jgi:hypothetical protein
MPTTLLALLAALLVLAILIWGADRLLALAPGYPRLIAAIRIIAIVAIALYVLSLIAGFFGIPLPWGPGLQRRH